MGRGARHFALLATRLGTGLVCHKSWKAPEDDGDDCYFGAITDLLTNHFGYFGYDAVVAAY